MPLRFAAGRASIHGPAGLSRLRPSSRRPARPSRACPPSASSARCSSAPIGRSRPLRCPTARLPRSRAASLKSSPVRCSPAAALRVRLPVSPLIAPALRAARAYRDRPTPTSRPTSAAPTMLRGDRIETAWRPSHHSQVAGLRPSKDPLPPSPTSRPEIAQGVSDYTWSTVFVDCAIQTRGGPISRGRRAI